MSEKKVSLLDIYKQVDLLRRDIEKKYVSKSEFAIVKTLVYGFSGSILVAVVTALINGVVKAYAK